MAGEPCVGGLLIVGCSRRKIVTSRPVAALDLYQGWCIPLLRERLSPEAPQRRRVLILSAHYGLVRADELVSTYDRRMTTGRAGALRLPVRRAMAGHLASYPSREALVLVEERYLTAMGLPCVPVVHVIADPVTHFAAARRILDSWSWP
ncbi:MULTISPECIES: DUF6884 domain-containing protein [Streptomyces]|uniref:DUF6884 domain-containing protein n=1 Tax=Streptomyces TaxID=1883 RepID=UPI00163CEE04|nr:MULTISPECIES: DUF6884 domain-containing protein [Streptomyces]MBC2879319.1 hypothetical protein [Streptomyces sp. TYQ1024]UBI40081.1 hypothetical protein K7I03_28910 [Streptomyces mobaraensis]UKW32660.1 hypothetical protein MCU78_28840 [Streptomyces sp. TYQ1024]